MAGTELEAVRADLGRRVAAMEGRKAAPAELAREVDAIRAIAQRNGMHPAVTVAHLLDDALSRGERGPLVHGWLQLLGDAVRSDRSDPAATSTFAAACAVRFIG